MDDFAIDGDGAVFHLKGMAKYSSWPRTSLMHFFKGMAEYSSWPRRTSLMHLLDGVWMSIWAFSYVVHLGMNCLTPLGMNYQTLVLDKLG